MKYKTPTFRLKLVREPRSARIEAHCITTPNDVADHVKPLIESPEEHFIVLLLNTKNEVLGVHEVSHGTLSSSLVHPREVFKAAILANAYAIIAVHNHPSGSRVSASTDDLSTTEQLLGAAHLMGIPLTDHCIVNPYGEVFSIRENHGEIWDRIEKASVPEMVKALAV